MVTNVISDGYWSVNCVSMLAVAATSVFRQLLLIIYDANLAEVCLFTRIDIVVGYL